MGHFTRNILLSLILASPCLASWDYQSLGCPEDVCKESCNCTCVNALQRNRAYELVCPDDVNDTQQDVRVGVDSSEGGTVQFRCTRGNSLSDYRMLQGLNLGSNKVFSASYCPFPSVPFRQLFASVGLSKVKYLQFTFSDHGHHLTRNLLSGLGEITHLTLTNNQFTDIPEDLFMETGNLTLLYLRNNLLRLPTNIFRPVPKLEILELGANNFSHLEPGIFRNLTKLRLLNLWGNQLKNLTRRVFSDLANLESLDLSSNLLTSLPPDVFSDLPKLKNISLNKNSFIALPQGLFLSNPLLQEFKISHNLMELKVIPPGLLSHLPNLQVVLMSNSMITSLPDDMLWGSMALTTVDLSGNRLAALPAKFFKDNENLLDINLSSNRLSALANGTFDAQRKLTTLKLSMNNLTELSGNIFRELERLVTFSISYNAISRVARHQFPSTLLNIDLSHNQITDLTYIEDISPDSFGPVSVFQSSLNVEKIDVSYNQLRHLYGDWFTKVHLKEVNFSHNNVTFISTEDADFMSGATVDLSYNNITIVDFNNLEKIARSKFIEPHEGQTGTRGTRLILKGNPLVCDCKAYGLMRLLRGGMIPEVHHLVEVEANDLVCHEPLILHSKLARDVDPIMVNCPWEEYHNNSKCPKPCSCRYRPHTASLYVDCSSKNLTTWPETLPIPNQGDANHTELYLFNNLLSTMPGHLHSSYRYVTHLYLSGNRMNRLNISLFSPHLQMIDLDNNNFTSLDHSLRDIEALPKLSTITLMNNPWKCDCSAKNFLNFVQINFRKVQHFANITCSNGAKLANLTSSDLCPISGTAIGIGSVVVALIGLFIGGLIALYYRYQKEIKVWLYAHRMCLWFVTEDELDKDKKYDAFISYSHQDEAFVVNELVRVLENNSPKYKLCLHYRDWVVGDFIPNQIARSVEESRRTVVVLSPSFIESVWGRMEFRTAHSQALSEKRARVIIILHGDIGDTESLDPELKAYLSMNTYVKYGDPWFWDKLLYALPHPPEITKGIPSLCRRRPNRPKANEKAVAASTENGIPPSPPAAFNIIEPLKTLSNTKPV